MPKFKPELPTWLQEGQESVFDSLPMKALRKAGDILGGDDLIGSTMGAVGAPIEIPMKSIQRLLGMPHRLGGEERAIQAMLQKRARSPIIKDQLQDRTKIGSRESSLIASGLSPHKSTLGIPKTTYADRRFAAEDLYRLSQEFLEDLGVRESDSVVLHRGGPLHKPEPWLTPTHVDKNTARWFERGLEDYNVPRIEPPISSTFEVPRQSVRALVGILRAGDDFSTGEMLVPSGTLMRNRVGGTATPKSALQETPDFVGMRNPRTAVMEEGNIPTDNRVWVNQAVPHYLRRLMHSQKQGGGGGR